MKKISILFKFLYAFISNYIPLWFVKQKAKTLHATTRKQYHVIKVGKRKFMVVDNSFVKTYNDHIKGKGKGPKIDVIKMNKIAYFSTK
jgi:hypothetical protein